MSGYVAIRRLDSSCVIYIDFITDYSYHEYNKGIKQHGGGISYSYHVNSIEDFKKYIISVCEIYYINKSNYQNDYNETILYKTPFTVDKDVNGKIFSYPYYIVIGSCKGDINNYKNDKYGVKITKRSFKFMMNEDGGNIPKEIYLYGPNDDPNIDYEPRISHINKNTENVKYSGKIKSDIVRSMLKDLDINYPLWCDSYNSNEFVDNSEINYIKAVWFIQQMIKQYKEQYRDQNINYNSIAIFIKKYPIDYNVTCVSELKMRLMSYVINNDLPLQECSVEIQQFVDNWKLLADYIPVSNAYIV